MARGAPLVRSFCGFVQLVPLVGTNASVVMIVGHVIVMDPVREQIAVRKPQPFRRQQMGHRAETATHRVPILGERVRDATRAIVPSKGLVAPFRRAVNDATPT